MPERADAPVVWRRHTMLVFGHVVLYLLTLLVMVFPFSGSGWKRLLGIKR